MDGLQMLRRVMRERPTPIVMLSSLTQERAAATIEALALGAVDVVGKPGGGISLNLREVRDELIEKVRLAAKATIPKLPSVSPKEQQRVKIRKPTRPQRKEDAIVIVGSSTGGPSALTHIVPRLPDDFPVPIVHVQHMPAGFTATLAQRLHTISHIDVREAIDGHIPSQGEAWFAPGGTHLVFDDEGAMRFHDGPPHLGVRPAVVITVASAVERWASRVILLILTGMGMDGARGARLVKQAGGTVLVQNEKSSVVFGMPRAVIEMGYADAVYDLTEIPNALVHIVQ